MKVLLTPDQRGRLGPCPFSSERWRKDHILKAVRRARDGTLSEATISVLTGELGVAHAEITAATHGGQSAWHVANGSLGNSG